MASEEVIHGGEVNVGCGTSRLVYQRVIRNLENRVPNTRRAAMGIKDGHHHGRTSFLVPLSLPSNVRIVYIDIRKVRSCSFDSAAFHSFAWPRSSRGAKSSARTLFSNHCKWVDILIVRGRCFGRHRSCLAANRVLESLQCNWKGTQRPYVVYKEGYVGRGDPIPKWPGRSPFVRADFCQCNLIEEVICGQRWHHPGAIRSNIHDLRYCFPFCEGHRLYSLPHNCEHSQVECYYPHKDGTIHLMNERILKSLVSTVVDVCKGWKPVVPPRYDPGRRAPPIPESVRIREKLENKLKYRMKYWPRVGNRMMGGPNATPDQIKRNIANHKAKFGCKGAWKRGRGCLNPIG